MDASKLSNYPQNKNPNATIGFSISYPLFFYVNKNIYKHLEKKAEFIVDVGFIQSTGSSKEILEDVLDLLQKHGVYYRILFTEDYSSERYLKNFFKKYKALVGPWEFKGLFQLEATKNIKKINTPYGAGKELSKMRPSRGMNDLVLACGKREKVLFSYYTRAEIVGTPRFDDWFNNSLDAEFIQDLKNKLDPKKKTILHLPTHGDLAETHTLIKDLGLLTEKYNVITKLHYHTIREEVDLAQKFSSKNILVFKDSDDLLCLLKVADMVLADNSSAIFDAILADKPILVSHFLSEEYIDTVHQKGIRTKRGMVRALTYSKSIDQKIKSEGLVLTFKKPEQLTKKIKETLLDKKFFKNARKKIRRELFSYNDGRSGVRAAKLIEKIIREKGLTPRPILYWALRAHENFLGVPVSVETKKNYRP